MVKRNSVIFIIQISILTTENFFFKLYKCCIKKLKVVLFFYLFENFITYYMLDIISAKYTTKF